MLARPRRRAALEVVVFSLLAGALPFAVGPVAGLAIGLAGVAPSAGGVAYGSLVSVAVLGLTWAALRRDGEGWAALGLVPTRRRAIEFGAGFGAAAVLFAGVAGVRAASVGAGWVFDPGAGVRAVALGLPAALVLLLWEELAFRGYAFRKAVAVWGAPAALTVSALLFGAYHLGGDVWGMAAVFRFLTTACGGLLFGYAAVRTGGLALPLGLHLGGNWIGASVLGLGFEGGAVWSAPLTAGQVAALTAPDVLPHLPYFAAVGLLAVWVARRWGAVSWRPPAPCPGNA